MHYRTLAYGREGWDERTRIVEGIVASRSGAPYIYNDVLVLVPSLRKKQRYGRLFVDALERVHGARALVQPDIQTLHQFIAKLYAALDGPRLIDENSRLVLLERLVKEVLLSERLFDTSPELLAPALAAALGKTIEDLAEAGTGSHDLSVALSSADCIDKPQVRLLLAVYKRYREALAKHGLTDPPGMVEFLLGKFDASWLRGYREIIIDEVQFAGKQQLALLKKMMTCAHCTLLVEAPSPRMLDPEGEFHPLKLVRDMIVSLDVAPGESNAPAGHDDLFVSSALFTDKSFDDLRQQAPQSVSFQKELNLLSAVNMREEVSLIAGMVKRAIRGGLSADSILVTFPGLDEYGPLIEEVFADYGVPYNRALGRQLSTSPVTTAIVALLRSCHEEYSGPSLLRVFGSPFLKFALLPALAPTLDAFMRENRIIGGREKLISALKRRGECEQDATMLVTQLEDLFQALEPFTTPEFASLRTWMDRLETLAAWSGIDERVADVHGPLNINLQAFRRLKETFASLSRSGVLFPDYTYSFNEWFFLLKKTFMHTRFQVPAEDEGGVQILGLEESSGRPWNRIYFGGLIDGKFPPHPQQNIFLPVSTLERLGANAPERVRLHAASHFYRLLLSAEKVTLTLPENEGDRPTVPSQFLEELAPLRLAGLINRGIRKTTGIQFNLSIEESHSVPELAKATALMANKLTSSGLPVPTEWIDALSAKMPNSGGIEVIKNALDPPSGSSAPASGSPRRCVFRVTELDDYLNCPYDYYVKHVLNIGPLEEISEDISSLDRGGKVHAVLRNFYLSWTCPVTRDNKDEARKLLCKLADSAFSGMADTIHNRREKQAFVNIMIERFLHAEERFWTQGFKPVYLEKAIDGFKLDLSDGQTAELTAKIDRIDADPEGRFMIVDYKTGRYPAPRMGLEQDVFQLPIYANMAFASLLKGKPALRDVVGLAYYDLAGNMADEARDMVLYNKEAVQEQSCSKPKASAKSAEEFHTILDMSMEKARKAVEGILRREFAPVPRDIKNCRRCVNHVLCGNHRDES